MRPTYAELASAFWTLVAETNNDGDPVAPSESDLERATEVLNRTGVVNPYPGFPA